MQKNYESCKNTITEQAIRPEKTEDRTKNSTNSTNDRTGSLRVPKFHACHPFESAVKQLHIPFSTGEKL